MQKDRISPSSIEALAGEALAEFTTATRSTDGSEYVTLRDSAGPEWVYNMVREAHDDELPNDWRYEMVKRALEFVEECGADGAEDHSHEFADGATEVYSGPLLEWLAGHGQRAGYCDEAAEEGLTADDANLMDRIRVGQYMALEQLFTTVTRHLKDRQAEIEAEIEAIMRRQWRPDRAYAERIVAGTHDDPEVAGL